MSDRPKIIYVVAGNFIQYKEYVMNKSQNVDKQTTIIARNIEELQIGDTIYKYLNSADQLRGIEDPKGVFYGSYYMRPDICDIIQQLSIRKLKNVMDYIPEKHKKHIQDLKMSAPRITGITISVTPRKDEN